MDYMIISDFETYLKAIMSNLQMWH